METPLGNLLPLYTRERAAGRALALCVLLETAGSTYSKAGALLLIAQSGEYAGLLSGGCLEGDLRQRATQVIASGEPCTVEYDMRGPDDLLWGLGSGCEGAMRVFVLRVSEHNAWQPLAALEQGWREHRAQRAGIVLEAGNSAWRAGEVIAPWREESGPGLTGRSDGAALFVLALQLPPRILLLGAGPDAQPVVDFAARLGWKVTVVDHRSAYLEPVRFPAAERVLESRPEALATKLDLSQFNAAVVMSHHLPSDLAYLRVLAHSSLQFIGLLGPAPRRDRLRMQLGADVAKLDSRLHAPVGLAIGGRSSSEIALAIVAELQAWLNGCSGGPFSQAGT